LNFIELLLGIAPDGGSGALEFTLALVVFVGLIPLVVRRAVRNRADRSSA
jgi:hypothetical protein